jgi:hypothetical protein
MAAREGSLSSMDVVGPAASGRSGDGGAPARSGGGADAEMAPAPALEAGGGAGGSGGGGGAAAAAVPGDEVEDALRRQRIYDAVVSGRLDEALEQVGRERGPQGRRRGSSARPDTRRQRAPRSSPPPAPICSPRTTTPSPLARPDQVEAHYGAAALASSPGLGFRLRVQQFLELVRARAPPQAVLEFGRAQLGPAAAGPEDEELLSDAVSLLAYADPEASPCGNLLSVGGEDGGGGLGTGLGGEVLVEAAACCRCAGVDRPPGRARLTRSPSVILRPPCPDLGARRAGRPPQRCAARGARPPARAGARAAMPPGCRRARRAAARPRAARARAGPRGGDRRARRRRRRQWRGRQQMRARATVHASSEEGRPRARACEGPRLPPHCACWTAWKAALHVNAVAHLARGPGADAGPWRRGGGDGAVATGRGAAQRERRRRRRERLRGQRPAPGSGPITIPDSLHNKPHPRTASTPKTARSR